MAATVLVATHDARGQRRWKLAVYYEEVHRYFISRLVIGLGYCRCCVRNGYVGRLFVRSGRTFFPLGRSSSEKDANQRGDVQERRNNYRELNYCKISTTTRGQRMAHVLECKKIHIQCCNDEILKPSNNLGQNLANICSLNISWRTHLLELFHQVHVWKHVWKVRSVLTATIVIKAFFSQNKA